MRKMYAILTGIIMIALAIMAPVTRVYACGDTTEAETPQIAGVPLYTVTNPDGTVTTTTDGTPALIIVHRVSCTANVYNKDSQLLRTLTVSTGREGHRTPLGTYSIYEHTIGDGYHLMVDGTYAKYCMRWKKGGYMFHTVCYAKSGDAEPIQEEVDALGTSVSRGCVRLSVTDAEWLYNATPNGCTVQIVDD